MSLLRGQHQGRAEKCAHAGGPPHREHDSQEQGREKAHAAGGCGSSRSPEQAEPDHTQEIQAKDDHHSAGYQVDCGLMLPQEAADCSGQRAQSHEYQGEPCDKAERPLNRPAQAPFSTARKIGEVDGQHREQAG